MLLVPKLGQEFPVCVRLITYAKLNNEVSEGIQMFRKQKTVTLGYNDVG